MHLTDQNNIFISFKHTQRPSSQATPSEDKNNNQGLSLIDLPSFRTDIAQGLGDLDDSLPVTDLLDIYDTQLTTVLNKHAPPKEKSIVIRPQQPWFPDDHHRAKSEKRKAERLWRRTGLTVHREIFKEEKAK